MNADYYTIIQVIFGCLVALYPIMKKYVDSAIKQFQETYFKWRERYTEVMTIIAELQAQIVVIQTKVRLYTEDRQLTNEEISDLISELQKLNEIITKLRKFTEKIFDELLKFKPTFSFPFPKRGDKK